MRSGCIGSTPRRTPYFSAVAIIAAGAIVSGIGPTIDAIAVLDESPQFDRRALNRFIGVAIPVVATATALASVASGLKGVIGG